MKVRCPDCGSRGTLNTELAGQMVRCPQCGGAFPAKEDPGAGVGASWYYALGNEKKGPLNEEEFAGLVESGVIVPDTLVWSKGMTAWQTLVETRGEQTVLLAKDEAPQKMKVRCPECGRGGMLNRALAGQTVRCPQCRNTSLAKEDLGTEPVVKWFYAHGSEKKGPISAVEFDQLVASGVIAADTLIWCKGMTGWQPLVGVMGEHTVVLPKEELPLAQEVPVEGTPSAATGPRDLDSQKSGRTGLAYAGAGKRLVAKVIDFVFMFAWASLVEGLSRKLFPESFTDSGAINSIYLTTVFVCFLLGMFYTTWFVGRFGATPGKMVMNLKVVTPVGGRVSYGQAFGRYWAEFGVEALTLLLGYLLILIDSQRRGLHDRLCGTRVVVL